jgi:hypothetical protein
MVHDYWMLRDDPDFIAQMVPGTRGVLSWFGQHVDETGMLGPIPWWGFLDWNPAYPMGMAPGSKNSHSTALTLQYAYALQRAAELEEAHGISAVGSHYREQAASLIAAVRKHAWDAGRGLFADTPERKSFSQHANALAILTDAVPAQEQAAVMGRTLDDESLLQATYYFRFYVDEAMVQAGFGDRYLERLEPWREMLRKGLTTTPETPDPSRSDSHAWSAHPNYHLLASVLGIRPASEGFGTVEIAPALGKLNQAAGSMPHPLGQISVSFRRENGRLQGEVSLPQGLTGELVWKGKKVRLTSGSQQITVRD